MRRFALILIFSLLAAVKIGAADPESEQFQAATAAFNDKFYERADQQLGEFVAKYPNSTNSSLALLMQGQARALQKKFDPALEVLKKNEGKAGPLLDQFLFWEGEALFQKGDFGGAAQMYARVLSEFPHSPLALQSAFSEAGSLFQGKDFNAVIAKLRDSKGSFAVLGAAATNNVFVFRGDLLLAEALLATGKLDEARTAALAARSIAGQPELDWEKFQLLARIETAGAKPESALGYITNAVNAAKGARKPLLESDSLNLEADLFRKLNRNNDAINSYEKIALLPNLSIDQKRLAVLKQVELYSSSGAITNAINRVESYLNASTNEPAADLLRVKAGDLWLQQFRALTGNQTDLAPGIRSQATNALTQARTHLNIVLTQFTNSVHLGKAWLNLGWSYWEEGTAFDDSGKIGESQNAFRNAITQLTRSDDQALARFKLADADFSLGQYANAITNYLSVIQQYADLPQVKNTLFEQSYRKIVRASLELKDFDGARSYIEAFRKAFPSSLLMQETIFYLGQSLIQNKQPGEARKVLEGFEKEFPQSQLIPQVKFAEARSYISEGNWAGALEKDEQWLAAYTNNELRAEVEFQRANLYDKTGRRTNAFNLFTNFVARFPLHRLAPAAQSWVADYYYSDQEWPLAEQNYQKIFQNTNWTASPLFYDARLMAAKTAFFRQAYSDAKSYLTNIITDPHSPTNIVVQALFELGDVTIEEPITGTTNKLNNYSAASVIFDRIGRKYPSDPLAPLAWGKKGDCHLHLYPAYAQSFEAASNSYSMVLQLSGDQTPVAVIDQAEYGLGLLNEKAAENHAGAEKTAFLKTALSHYLNVVYGANLKGRQPSPLYLKLAGRDAGRLAEALDENAAALELYKRLARDIPSMKQVWEARMNALRQKLASN